MKQKILNILNEFAMKIDNHEEVITESSFEGLADELVKIVSPFEARVSPMHAEEIKKARIKENLYWIEWLREVEVACPDREEYESRIEEIEKE